MRAQSFSKSIRSQAGKLWQLIKGASRFSRTDSKNTSERSGARQSSKAKIEGRAGRGSAKDTQASPGSKNIEAQRDQSEKDSGNAAPKRAPKSKDSTSTVRSKRSRRSFRGLYRRIKRFVKQHPTAVVLLAVAATVGIVYVSSGSSERIRTTLFIPKTSASTYRLVYLALKERLSQTPSMSIRVRVSDEQSVGSRRTLELLRLGKISLGLVQMDAYLEFSESNPDTCGIVAKMYDEHMLMFVRDGGEMKSFEDLVKSVSGTDKVVRICCLDPKTSQTAVNLEGILKYYNATTNFKIEKATSYEHAKEQLRNNQVKAAFFVSGLGHPVIQDLSNDEKITVLGFENSSGLSTAMLGVNPTTVAVGILGWRQTREIVTVATPCVLVLSNRVTDSAAREFAQHLHDDSQWYKSRANFMSVMLPPDDCKRYAHACLKPLESKLERLLAFFESAFASVRGALDNTASLITALITILGLRVYMKKTVDRFGRPKPFSL